jgi:acyl-CoA dehydrogenase
MTYRAPVADFRFIFDHVADLARVTATARFADATPDVTEAILLEAGKLCEERLAPLQRAGDLHPARLENGRLRTTPGYAEAYGAIAAGG